jgi:hypothetical protein
MKSNELSLNRLTEGQSVPRPHFGDASIVFDSDGVFKYIDGNDGAMKLIYPPANILFLYPDAKISVSSGATGFHISIISGGTFGSVVDFGILGPYLQTYSGSGITSITTFKNISLLTQLKNIGTGAAFVIQNMSLSATTLNQIFTDLPPTTNTATIDVRFNTGSAACDPTIATAKGYIVDR